MPGFDFSGALEEMIECKIKEYVPIITAGKTRFTAEDIASMYGIHKDNARKMINNGDFGTVIVVSPRNKVVTLEGVLEFESLHKGGRSNKAAKNNRIKRISKDPERI